MLHNPLLSELGKPTKLHTQRLSTYVSHPLSTLAQVSDRARGAVHNLSLDNAKYYILTKCTNNNYTRTSSDTGEQQDEIIIKFDLWKLELERRESCSATERECQRMCINLYMYKNKGTKRTAQCKVKCIRGVAHTHTHIRSLIRHLADNPFPFTNPLAAGSREHLNCSKANALAHTQWI